MEHALNLAVGLLAGLFSLIVAAIGLIEGSVRHLLASVGIGGPLQTVILVVVLVLLIVSAFRVFGGIFAVLIAVVLAILLLHAVLSTPMDSKRLAMVAIGHPDQPPGRISGPVGERSGIIRATG